MKLLKPLVILILFSFALQGMGQDASLDSLKFRTKKGAFVKVKGKTKGVYQKKLDSVTVKVYIGNTMVYSNFFPRGRFDLTLPLNQKLLIQIERSDYYPKRITVNTKLPEDKRKPYYLIFDFHMIEKRKLKGLDDFILDFPTGLISYNPQKFRFDYAEKYTKKMFRELNKLIDKAEKREAQEQREKERAERQAARSGQ